MTDYFNTNNEKGMQLMASEQKAANQECQIIQIFLRYDADELFSPEVIHNMLDGISPLTSTRRAMSNMTKKGLLIKTDEMVTGVYGKLTHTWKLNPEVISDGEV